MDDRIEFFDYSKCCVCPSYVDGNSKIISSDDRDLVLLKKNVFIPEGARCCSQHMFNNRLKMEAIDKLTPSSIQYKNFNSTDIQLMITRW